MGNSKRKKKYWNSKCQYRRSNRRKSTFSNASVGESIKEHRGDINSYVLEIPSKDANNTIANNNAIVNCFLYET